MSRGGTPNGAGWRAGVARAADGLGEDLTRCRAHRRLALALAGTVVLFALAGLARAWDALWVPYTYYRPSARDDYEVYHYLAINILEQGLAMPAGPVPYVLPAGFLYIYFVALWYRLLGVHPPAVFVVQSAMLGASVALLVLAFRPRRAGRVAALMLAALSVFAFLDVWRYYAFQLFSENLVIFELALFAYLVRAGFLDGRRWARTAALAVLGTIPLTRPNAVLFVPAVLAWLVARHRGPGVRRDLALGVLALLLVSSAMGLRNYVAGGRWIAFPPTAWRALDVPGYGFTLPGAEAVVGPVERREGAAAVVRLAVHALWRDPAGVLPEYGRRVLFVAGFVPLGHPSFRYRPHWMLLWLTFAGGLAWRLARSPRPGPMLELLLIWLVAYLGPLVVMSSIHNYGFRYVVPGVLPAVAGAAALVAAPPPEANRSREAAG